MTTVLLDTHVIHWFSAEPQRISSRASAALLGSDDLVVSAISWLELAWLAKHERIVITTPIRSWLDVMSGYVRTVGITPAIADAAVSLPATFPSDPADRLIYATSVELGLPLVTKDRRMRNHRHPGLSVIW